MFCVGCSTQPYSMVRLNRGDEVPSDLNCIYVLSVPLKEYEKWSLSDNFTHSVVLLLNSDKVSGYMLEYNNSSTIQVSPCRLVKRNLEDSALGNVTKHKGFKNFKGFYRCQLNIDQLLRFKKLFEEFSDYSEVKHNCHSFHCSLVATAMMRTSQGEDFSVLYSYRKAENMFANVFFTCDKWITLDEGSRYAHTVPSDKIIRLSLSSDILKDGLLIDVEALPVQSYDPRKHTVVCEHNMTLSVDNVVNSITTERDHQKTMREAEQRLESAIELGNISQLENVLVDSIQYHGIDFCPEKVKEATDLRYFLHRLRDEVQAALETPHSGLAINMLQAIFSRESNARHIFRPRDLVLIQGLRLNVSLNGSIGVVESYKLDKQRFVIHANERPSLVKSVNLSFVSNEDSGAASDFDPVITKAKAMLMKAREVILVQQIDSAIYDCNLARLEEALGNARGFASVIRDKIAAASTLRDFLCHLKTEVKEAVALTKLDKTAALNRLWAIFGKDLNAKYVLKPGDIVLIVGLRGEDFESLNGCTGEVKLYQPIEKRFNVIVNESSHLMKTSSLKFVSNENSDPKLNFDPVITEAKTLLTQSQKAKYARRDAKV